MKVTDGKNEIMTKIDSKVPEDRGGNDKSGHGGKLHKVSSF